MRQPKRNFVHKAGVAVYLDANIATLKECRHGCAHDAEYACIHRFGPRVYAIAQQDRISFTRLSDLQVILDFLHVILVRWKNGTEGVWRRRYVILTNDRRFLQHAEQSFRQERNMRKLPLRFVPGGIRYEIRGYPWGIAVEVHVLPPATTQPPNNLRDAIAYARAQFDR